jgi:hypothetical protein
LIPTDASFLQTFFEGVLALVAGGVREEEVCYRVAYSKSELRKVVALYPPKEVQKGLENLYVGLQKRLSAEANLLQVRLLPKKSRLTKP